MKAFLDHFAAILGAFTVTLVVVSVTHEYGYFTLIGRHLQTLLTTTDYFANSIVWLPFVIFMLLLSVEWGYLREVPERRKRNWKNWREWIRPSLVTLFFMFFLLTMTWPPNVLGMTTVTTAIVFVWGRIWPRVYDKIGWVGEEWQAIAKHLVRFGPPFLVAVFVWGMVDASIDLDRAGDPYFFHFKHRERAEVRYFLRNFDKGVLVKDPASNFIEFIRWDDLASVETQARGRTRSMACRFFDFACPQIKETPPLP
jgi:hypothetical protein